MVQRTREECRQEAELATAKIREQHQADMDRHDERYRALRKEFDMEVDHRKRVEADFRVSGKNVLLLSRSPESDDLMKPDSTSVPPSAFFFV